jgi:predicted transcriptional regulator
VVLLVKVEGLASSHRSRIEIIADILDEVGDGARKTHIMYRCNLSFKQLETYLNLLLNRGLLKRIPEEGKSNCSRSFEITDKGQILLQAYQSLKALLAP